MTPTRKANRPGLLSHAALAGALAVGITMAGAIVAPQAAHAAKEPKAPKLKLSKGFIAAAQPAQTAVNAVVAGDAATEGAAKAAVDAAIAAVTAPDDKFTAGSLLLNLGSKAKKARISSARGSR